MALQKRRRLVVDASIASSASTTEKPESSWCRRFLETLRESRHLLVMTRAIQEEWVFHQSKFSMAWLATMTSRGRIHWLNHTEDKALRRKIRKHCIDKSKEKVMLDDVHLIEASLSADRIVASRDDEARNEFAAATAYIDDLAIICWVNPVEAG